MDLDVEGRRRVILGGRADDERRVRVHHERSPCAGVPIRPATTSGQSG